MDCVCVFFIFWWIGKCAKCIGPTNVESRKYCELVAGEIVCVDCADLTS